VSFKRQPNCNKFVFWNSPFTWSDPCVQYGMTVAYDEKAAIEAEKAIKELITPTLKP